MFYITEQEITRSWELKEYLNLHFKCKRFYRLTIVELPSFKNTNSKPEFPRYIFVHSVNLTKFLKITVIRTEFIEY